MPSAMSVCMRMHSPSVVPCSFLRLANWSRTSVMISAAALPTEIIVSAAKR